VQKVDGKAVIPLSLALPHHASLICIAFLHNIMECPELSALSLRHYYVLLRPYLLGIWRLQFEAEVARVPGQGKSSSEAGPLNR
jgi:hypothetical protein